MRQVASNTARRAVHVTIAVVLSTLPTAPPAYPQQPFVTDDAAVTPPRTLHIEFSNEFDWLPDSSRPSLAQNSTSLEFVYGVRDAFEAGIELPLIILVNDRGSRTRTPVGLGDIGISGKYRIREQSNDRAPAVAISGTIGVPSGDKDRGLGSALIDYVFCSIFEWALRNDAAFRLNAGLVLAGNTQSGALGIRDRGTVVTTAGSLVRQFTPHLDLGVEIAAGVPHGLEFAQGQLRVQAGGNYRTGDCCTLDFGFVAGRFAASPRLGLQVGLSADIGRK